MEKKSSPQLAPLSSDQVGIIYHELGTAISLLQTGLGTLRKPEGDHVDVEELLSSGIEKLRKIKGRIGGSDARPVFAELKNPIPSTTFAAKPKIAVIDDEKIVLAAWKKNVTDAEVFGFTDPEAFLSKLRQDPAFAKELSCVVTDYNFDDSPAVSPESMAREIKATTSLPVILSTAAPLPSDFLSKPDTPFDALIDKDPIGWMGLSQILLKQRSRT